MKVVLFVLLAMLAGSLPRVDVPKARPATPPSDQLVLTERFIRAFFPGISTRHASIEFRSSIGVGVAPAPGEVTFEVIDICAPPPIPGMPQVGNGALPCPEYGKTYKSPLRGAIWFTTRDGKVVPVNGYFHGSLLAESGPCPQPGPISREDFIGQVHLEFLSTFLGRKARVIEVVREPGNEVWTVRVQAGPRGSLHSSYDFHIAYCGYVTSFYLKN